MKSLTIIFLVFISIDCYAQWPGAYYGFELVDADGNRIDSMSKDYTFELDTAAGPKSIRLCEDNKLWRLYKGDKYLYVPSILTIEKISEGGVSEKMYIEFPPPLTNGKDKYYTNLYLGTIKFTPGNYKINFPMTSDEWDSLKEMELCPDPYNYNLYFDLSGYQKIK